MRWMMLLGLVCATSLASSMSDDMLAAHNAIRAKLKLPPLVWSDNLAKAAQDWANTLLKERTFRHPATSPWGQNLFEIYRDEYNPGQIVTEWASEAVNYNYKTNQCKGMCGHYTQIVWRDTKELGCAVARGGDREVWVCDYSPPGNYQGERPY
jgi:pathogenesis-related protein 1